MPEQMFHYIKIGGTIRAADLSLLLMAGVRDGAIAENDIVCAAPLRPKLALVDDYTRGEWLWLECVSKDMQAFPAVKVSCKELNLPYDCHDISEWSYDGLVCQYRPGQEPVIQAESAITSERLTEAEAEAVMGLLERGATKQAMDELEGATNRSLVLPPFTII